jgi:hypothetical protein
MRWLVFRLADRIGLLDYAYNEGVIDGIRSISDGTKPVSPYRPSSQSTESGW